MEGPCFFGGCSELCCDNRFGVERSFDRRLGADPFRHEAAVITRRKPDSFAGFARELFTDVRAASPSFAASRLRRCC